MIFLEKQEIELLTGYKKPFKQRAELTRMGVPFILRHDGFPIVHNAILQMALGSPLKSVQHKEKPNFDGL